MGQMTQPTVSSTEGQFQPGIQ